MSTWDNGPRFVWMTDTRCRCGHSLRAHAGADYRLGPCTGPECGCGAFFDADIARASGVSSTGEGAGEP